MMLLQSNRACTFGQIAFTNWAWVIELFWAWPVRTNLLATTAADCRACSAKKTIPTCKVAITNARKTGAIRANSVAVAPLRARWKRDSWDVRRFKHVGMDRFI